MSRVLIADDNKNMTLTFSNFLTKEKNIEIIGIVNNGIDALNTYFEKKPDVLLLDLDMPKMNGLEVIEKLSNDVQEKKKNNIIVISGPSGVGKSTVIKEILINSSIIEQSISDTTRNSRGNGDSYHFIDEEEFLNNLKRGIYVEHNYYNGNYYGINKKVLRTILQKGHIALVDCNTAGL